MADRSLLSIVELGGYPDFRKLFQRYGYQTDVVTSMRKAMSFLKKNSVDVVFAEFNYQHAFRDRLSSLETLIAVLERKPEMQLVVFYEPEFISKLDILTAQYAPFAQLALPVEEAQVIQVLERLQV